MKKFLIFSIIGFFLVVFSLKANAQSADCSNPKDLNLDAIGRCLTEIQKAYELSVKATRPLESQLQGLQVQVIGIKNRVKEIENDIAIKKANINEGYKNLEKQQEILNATVRNYYIKSYYNSPILTFLSGSSASEITNLLAYQKAATDQDKIIITNIAISIADLERKKQNLENEQARLVAIKASLDEESAKLDDIVSGARAYQSVLSSQIAQLTAKQQQIIGQRLTGLNLPTSLGAGPLFCTDDRKLDPGFGNAFAFFTFGIPHRVGMNQYGALGRAQSGQNHEDILRAYFDNFNFEQRSNINISVQGYGSMPLETYLLGIYEMPESWPLEALKAQVIAARSYALSYTNNGSKEICTTQSCQVYKGGNKGGEWEKAVKETEGKTMVSGESPISAWYSSTDGGYTFTASDVGWNDRSFTKRLRDTNGDISSISDLFSKAYDKDSPCFYAAQGFRSQYAKSAWLKSQEAADIVNVILLARADSSTKDHFYQTDKPHPYGGEVWNEEKVKSELRTKNITPFNNISDISVNVDLGIGKTVSINISGDAGSQSFDGSEFKDWFNLRAPANIQIVGPLYNVERK